LNIWIFNHYAQCPNMPGGTRHFDLGKELVKRGHNVTIFAAGYHYNLLKDIVVYNNKGFKIELIDGVRFVWVKTYPYKKNNLKRMINITSYAWKLNKILPNLRIEKPDIIIGSTVHPFAPLIASKFAMKFKVPFIFEIRDLWPQTFIDMGVWDKKSIRSKVFKYIEKITVERSDKIIVLSPNTIDYIIKEYNFPKEKILLLPNGVDERFFMPISQEYRKKINITYVGGIDKVHGLEFLIDLAQYLRDESVEFEIYGDGKEKDNLLKLVKEKKINNIKFKGSISKAEVPMVLYKANLLFLSTSKVMYGSENKLYEYMASGKPLVVATYGKHNDPTKYVDCGVSLERTDPKGSAIKLMEFIKNYKEKFCELGKNGQNYALLNNKISLLALKLENFLES